jgi:hypothetical protein
MSKPIRGQISSQLTYPRPKGVSESVASDRSHCSSRAKRELQRRGWLVKTNIFSPPAGLPG